MGYINGNSSHFSGIFADMDYIFNGGGDLDLPLKSAKAPLSVNGDARDFQPIPPVLTKPRHAAGPVTRKAEAAVTLPETELQSKFRQLMAIFDKNLRPWLHVDSGDGKSDNGEFTRLAYDIYYGNNSPEHLTEVEIINYLGAWLEKELSNYFEEIGAADILKLMGHIELIASWQCDEYQYSYYDSAENKLLADKNIEDISDNDRDTMKREVSLSEWDDSVRSYNRKRSNNQAAERFQKSFKIALRAKLTAEIKAMTVAANISALKQYKEERKTKGKYHSKFAFLNPQKNSPTFFKRVYATVNEALNVFTQTEKNSAAKNLIKYLQGETTITFDTRQLGALRQGSLGKLVDKVVKDGLLPNNFFERNVQPQPEEQVQQKQPSRAPSLVLRALLIFIPTLALIADCFLSGMDFVEALI